MQLSTRAATFVPVRQVRGRATSRLAAARRGPGRPRKAAAEGPTADGGGTGEDLPPEDLPPEDLDVVVKFYQVGGVEKSLVPLAELEEQAATPVEDLAGAVEGVVVNAADAVEAVQAVVEEGADAAVEAAIEAGEETARMASAVAGEVQAEVEEGADAAVDAAIEAGEETAGLAAAVVEVAGDALSDESARPATSGAPEDAAAAPDSSAAALPPPSDGSTASGSSSPAVEQLKLRLVEMLAPLDRGMASQPDVVTRVDNLVAQLTAAAGPVTLTSPQRLGGRWRLIYSSAFATGSLGGARPGPPTGLTPAVLGPVYQDIRPFTAELDNVVQLSAKFSLASLPGLNIDPPTATARLKHKFEIIGDNTVRITYENTVVKTSGGLGGWLSALPEVATLPLPEFLRPPTKSARGAAFNVVYLDEGMRVTRGDRGEVRVFLKEPAW